MAIGEDYAQQARDYIYKRSIILAQDEIFTQHMIRELQSGTPLPQNDAEFEAIVRRFLAGMGMAAVDDDYADKMARYYTVLGTIRRRPRWHGALAVLLALGVLVATITGIIIALDDAGTREDVTRGVGIVRTVSVVVVVIALFLWTGTLARRFMVVVRTILLIALILALVWLLIDTGAIVV